MAQAFWTRRGEAAVADPLRAAGWTCLQQSFRALESSPPGPFKPGVTLAVCTMSRPASFLRLLESVERQAPRPEQVVVVDASSDDATERALREFLVNLAAFPETSYERVTGDAIGLTRQRNRAVRLAQFDLIVFFDDDIELLPGCLGELTRVHRESQEPICGVAAVLENGLSSPTPLWRLRRALGVVPTLEPGRYCRSGMSTPWAFLDGGRKLVQGDWLPGCAMMWRTDVARDLRFDESFCGYAQGEDLEFSLRAAGYGRLLVATDARCLHLHEPAGRPDHYRLGYMAIRNRWEIHRRALSPRTGGDVALFAYAWTLDTVLLLRNLLSPRRWVPTIRQIGGRLRAGYELLTNR